MLQEPLLFSGTIADNIRYGKPDASDEEVERGGAGGERARLHQRRCPTGYETMLGERGAKISGGERQRIAVARAFLRDAPILILDEPTSSIDSRTEAVILEALERLMEGRTTIVIAHRLSTLRSVDEILVMDDGRAGRSRAPTRSWSSRTASTGELWEAQTRRRGRPKSARPSGAAAGARRRRAAAERARGRAGRTAPSVPRPDTPGSAGAPPSAARRRRRDPRPRGELPRPKIVLLGMLTKIPVGGVAWLVGQYAAGFERLGYEVYYVEAHARTPSMFMTHDATTTAPASAAEYIAGIAERFGLEDRWAFQALHEDGRCFGMSAEQLDRLYRDAALIINMHGGTLPLPEHAATDRLVFLGTDPVEVELEVHRGDQRRDRVPRPARRLLHLGPQLRQPGLRAALGALVPVHPQPAAGRARLLGQRRRPRRRAVHDDRQLAPGLPRRPSSRGGSTAGASTSSS